MDMNGVRLDFIIAANAAAMCGDTFKWSSWLLKLSLQDDPLEGQITFPFDESNSNLWCDYESELSNELARTPAFQKTFSDFRAKLNSLPESQNFFGKR